MTIHDMVLKDFIAIKENGLPIKRKSSLTLSLSKKILELRIEGDTEKVIDSQAVAKGYQTMIAYSKMEKDSKILAEAYTNVLKNTVPIFLLEDEKDIKTIVGTYEDRKIATKLQDIRLLNTDILNYVLCLCMDNYRFYANRFVANGAIYIHCSLVSDSFVDSLLLKRSITKDFGSNITYSNEEELNYNAYCDFAFICKDADNMKNMKCTNWCKAEVVREVTNDSLCYRYNLIKLLGYTVDLINETFYNEECKMLDSELINNIVWQEYNKIIDINFKQAYLLVMKNEGDDENE